MPALAADWYCGDGTNKRNSLTDSKLTQNSDYTSDCSKMAVSQQNENVIRYLNGNIPHKNGFDDDIPSPKVSLFDPSRLRLHWTKHMPVGAGLSNLGNTCFLNSVLQCLVYTPPLAHHLSMGEHKRVCKVKDFCMLCVLQDHLSRSLCGGKAFKPLRVLQNLRNIAKSLTWGQQEDAHEFLRYVVDSMQKSCLFGTNGLDAYSKETTLVYQVFSGYLRSQVKCLRCMHASNTFDPFLDISVDIKDVSSLEEALVKFVTPEKLDVENAYKCERCKVRVPAHKRFTIHRHPNVLTIHMKRFDITRPLGSKISRHIRFPMEINIRPYMSLSQGEPIYYVLYGVLVHSGFSCNSGHYYSYVKAPNEQWHCMNDSMVTLTSSSTVLDSEAYILFYVRYSRTVAKDTKPHTITRPVTQNGSGDHQPLRIIGPLPPTHSTSSPNKQLSGVVNHSISVSDKPPASISLFTKFNSVKEKQAFSSTCIKSKNTTQVIVPSLVPYTENDTSENDFSPVLQICEDDPESVAAESKEDTKLVGPVREATSSASLHRFKPRAVLKPTPRLPDNTSKMLEPKAAVEVAANQTPDPAVLPVPEQNTNACSSPVNSARVLIDKVDNEEARFFGPNSPSSLKLTHDACASGRTHTLHNGISKPAISKHITSHRLSDNKPSSLKSITRSPKPGASRGNSCSPKRIVNRSDFSQSPLEDSKTDRSKYDRVSRRHDQCRSYQKHKRSHRNRYSSSRSPRRYKYHRSRSPHEFRGSRPSHRYQQRSSHRHRQSLERDRQPSDRHRRSRERDRRPSDRYRWSSNHYRRSHERYRESSERDGQSYEMYSQSYAKHGRSPIKHKKRRSKSPLKGGHSHRSRSRRSSPNHSLNTTPHHQLSSHKSRHLSSPSTSHKQSYSKSHSDSASISATQNSSKHTQSPSQHTCRWSHLKPSISQTAQTSSYSKLLNKRDLQAQKTVKENQHYFSNGEHFNSSERLDVSSLKQKTCKETGHSNNVENCLTSGSKRKRSSQTDTSSTKHSLEEVPKPAACSQTTSRGDTKEPKANCQMFNKEISFGNTESNLRNGLMCSRDLQQQPKP